MTTQVTIKITKLHNPVEVKTVNPETGAEIGKQVLTSLDDAAIFYVHSGQSLSVVEVTPS